MSAHGGPDEVTSGLVLALDAADIKSYPRTGTVWYDRSGLGNNGTLVGGVGYSNGAMVFDGNTGYVDTLFVPNSSVGSISVWYKMNVMKNYNTIFDNSAGGDVWEMWVYDYGLLRYRTNAYSDLVVEVGGLTTNRWYNTTLTFTASGAALYLNGVLVSVDPDSPARNVPQQLKIGGYLNTKFNGSMAIFQVYNRSLDFQEVLQNYNANKSRFGLS